MIDKNLDVLFYVPSIKEDLDGNMKQWVNNFKLILEISLSQILKRKANCQLSFKADTIEKSVVYIQYFLGKDFALNSTIQRLDGNKDLNVFHVVIDPDIVELLNEINSLKTYSFFNNQNGKILDLTIDLDDILNSTWLKISDLSFEIGKILKEKNTKTVKIQNKIFFAETSPDQVLNRNYLMREFKHLGYKVAPEKQLSNDIVPFSENVQELMEESVISVHIIGNNYAPLLNNIEISKIELQNDIFNEVFAKTKSEKKDFQRLVLIPPALKPKSDKQKKYIESFKSSIEFQTNTEVIQTPLEDFKSIIQKKIDGIFNKENDHNVISEKETGQKCIYIISNGNKSEKINDLKDGLKKNGIDYIETNAHKNKIDLIKQHQNNLTLCDGVIICYSSRNEQWLNSKLCDIVKSPGIGRKAPFVLKAILIDGVQEPNVNMDINDLMITNNKKSDYLNLLLDKIK